MSPDNDPALETLLLPFANGTLAWPLEGGGLFLHARSGWPLLQRDWPGLVCAQAFKPQFDALQRDGMVLEVAGDDSRYPVVLSLPPRQREHARAAFARALKRVAPGGRIVACMPNREGAKSGESDLAQLAGPLTTVSKNHCRVFWSEPLQGPIDPGLADMWEQLDAPRPILQGSMFDGRFASRPGVFAWDRIDPASALLAAHLPNDLVGHGADLGAGWGYLASEVLGCCAQVVALDLYESDARALALSRSNLSSQTTLPLQFHWHDVCAGLPRQYDFIVSNPPFHTQGHGERPDIGRAFITAAADALRPGGRFWLVANRKLPYESVLDARFGSVRTVAQAQGYKVIEAVRG